HALSDASLTFFIVTLSFFLSLNFIDCIYTLFHLYFLCPYCDLCSSWLRLLFILTFNYSYMSICTCQTPLFITCCNDSLTNVHFFNFRMDKRKFTFLNANIKINANKTYVTPMRKELFKGEIHSVIKPAPII